MSNPTIDYTKRWSGGISDFLKENANFQVPSSFYFSRSIDYRTDPNALTLLPGPVKESGSVVTDLLKWADLVPGTLTSYYTGSSGYFYSRNSSAYWKKIVQAPNSHGNGLSYFSGDNYVYLPGDSTINRYGPISFNFSIFEGWTGTAINPSIWRDWSGGQASIASSGLTLTSTLAAGFYGVEFNKNYDLTSYSITNQLVSVGSRSLSTYEVYPVYVVSGNSGNQLFWFIDSSNNLRAYKKVATVNTIIASTTYSATTHKYFSIREQAGTIYYDYSTDGINWVPFANVANPFQITSVIIGQQIGTSAPEVATTSALFDNFTYALTNNGEQFTANFLGAQGGVPTNTASLQLLSASSQYATAADSATLSIVGNLTLEAEIDPNNLPTVGNAMTLVGKWDESTNIRSYRLDLFGVSGFFGDGSDGSLTINSPTTEAPVDSACTGTAGTQILLATNASFAAGKIIEVYQTQGTRAGQWERNTIQGYTAGTIMTGTPLLGTYTIGAQVRIIPQYTSVTINSTYTAKAWNGTVGGNLDFLANGTVSGAGTITATGKGFRGGNGTVHVNGGSATTAATGEGTVGISIAATTAANGNGGGGGGAGGGDGGSGGGGGGNALVGATGTVGQNSAGTGGVISGSADLVTATFGGGGGGGGGESNANNNLGDGGNGGVGGGKIFITAATLSMTGSITANGGAGSAASGAYQEGAGGGGGGAGGSILLKSQVATLGTLLVTATAGAGGTGTGSFVPTGGTGSVGRIHLDYLTSYTGTTNPTLDVVQDNTLVTTTTIQARLGISNDGTAFEYLTQNLPTLQPNVWNRVSVSWAAANSLASFYLNAVPIGTSTGTKTAISDNASLLYIGATKTSVVTNFLNGLVDDVRVWSNVQTAGQIFANNTAQLTGREGGLAAYYTLNSVATDLTPNANNLTLVNSPTYSTNVPFVAPTTRLDIDASSALTGQTYTLLTAISESAVDELAFTPVNDPQASIAFYVDTKGTGDWTVTIHDQQNRVIATKTILNANVPSAGVIEFIFDTPWRLVAGKMYHIHLTVSTGTSKVVTGTASNLSTAEYTTYFGFLVTDTQYHPAIQFQYQPLGGVLTGAEIIGNERYLAVWDGANYFPNYIVFPPAWHVRCFGFWREFLAIGMWRGGNIYDFDQGRIYFWDGVAPTFNFFVDVPEGQINALKGIDSDLYIFAGYRGNLLNYQGGYFSTTGNSTDQKLKKMPLLSPSDYTEVYPGAFSMWRGLLHFGLYGASNSTTAQRGTYSYGTANQYYPPSLSYDYVISTLNKGNTVSIGLVYPIGQNLIIGWQDGISFGADVINFSNDPAPSGELQLLLKDGSELWKFTTLMSARADYVPLKTGESIDVKIRQSRFDLYTLSPIDTTVGSDFCKLPISLGADKEYQVGIDLYATGSTSPTILGFGIQKNENKESQEF